MKTFKSEVGYLYGYFFSKAGVSPRRVGWPTWLAELCFECAHKLRYPRFRYLYRLEPSQLGVTGPDSVKGTQYESVNSYALRQCFQALRRVAPLQTTTVFIDIGSGAGRVLHAAMRAGYSRLAGVEIAKGMCELAVENLRRYSGGHDLPLIVNENIRHVDFGALIDRFQAEATVDTVVCFLNNPFNRELMEVFAERLDAFRPFDVYLVCIWKQYPEVLLGHGFEVVHEQMRRNRFTMDSFRVYRRQGSSA